MAVSAAAVAKAAAMLLTNEKARKGVGWILVAVFSPVILLIALLCSLGSGGAEHNNYSVEACFYGAEFSAEVPAEFRYHIEEMRSAFSLLDSAVSSANGQMDSGNSLTRSESRLFLCPLLWGRRPVHTGGEQLRGVLLHHRNPNTNRRSDTGGRDYKYRGRRIHRRDAGLSVPGLRQSGSPSGQRDHGR